MLRTCHFLRFLFRVTTKKEARVVLNAYMQDGTYPTNTFDKFLKDKHPELWVAILPELTKHRLLR